MRKKFFSYFKNSYIQTFDDTKQNRKGMVMKFPIKELKAKFNELKKMNEDGAGIFFTPNPCAKGRKEEDVTSIDWIYLDMDEGTKEEMFKKLKESPLKPTIITESKRSYHAYWKCKFENKDKFVKVIKGIIQHFDGDPAISSTNEVLRLPGFIHRKDGDYSQGKPYGKFVIKVIEINDNEYKQEDMIKSFPFEDRLVEFKDRFDNLIDDDLKVIKDIPITDVLDRLSVRHKGNFILDEDGKNTSASINKAGNYINRFSGKNGSGSTIDAAMSYGNMSISEAIEWLKKTFGIRSASSSVRKQQRAKMIAERSDSIGSDNVLKDFYVAKKHNPRTWGVNYMDKIFKKPQEKDFIFFMGQPGTGKSSFCLHMAIRNSKNGISTKYLSLEMDKKELRERYIENICNITEQQRIDLNYTVTQKQEMDKCRLELENPNLTIIDEEDMFDDTSLDTIIEIAKTCDMLFIDNFNDIRHHGENKWDEQEKIGKKIKTLINSTPKAIIMLHHFSKGQTGKDKAEGGGSQTLVNVATRWITIERDMEDVCADSGVERTVKIKVQKNRPGGRISSVEIAYNNGRYRETIGGQDYELLQYDNPIDDQPSELL